MIANADATSDRAEIDHNDREGLPADDDHEGFRQAERCGGSTDPKRAPTNPMTMDVSSPPASATSPVSAGAFLSDRKGHRK